jgi:hypothetical protein
LQAPHRANARAKGKIHPMIVFNIACSQGHHFDGWFRSAEDFDRQKDGGLLECPLCGDASVTRQLSAPRINSGATEPAVAPAQSAQPREVLAASMLPGLQEHMLQQFKEFVRTNTENVGTEFAEKARRIHYGEEERRNIRGRVSAEDAVALHEEGIETVSLPPGVFLDEGLQ